MQPRPALPLYSWIVREDKADLVRISCWSSGASHLGQNVVDTDLDFDSPYPMPEAGGSTTQSGILFQNSLTSLYLGRLCDPRPQPDEERIIEVCTEVPDVHVDDIVVRYADGHRDLIQAKERLSPGDAEFTSVWQKFLAQVADPLFGVDDRVVLVVGLHQIYPVLSEIARRAQGSKDAMEWVSRLNKSQQKELSRIRICIGSSTSDAVLHSLFSRMHIDVLDTGTIENERARYWMPDASINSSALFRKLREKVPMLSKLRKSVTRNDVIKDLLKDGVLIFGDGAAETEYRRTLGARLAKIEISGQKIGLDAKAAYVWPSLRTGAVLKVDDDEMPLVRFFPAQRVALNRFPEAKGARAVLVAGAGFGKTELIRAIARERVDSGWLPGIVHLPRLQARDKSLALTIERLLNDSYNVSIPWERAFANGTAVLLFDGLDELSAHSRTRTLEDIEIFTERFPDCSWLLATRSDALLGAKLAVPRLVIEPLDNERRARLVRGVVTQHAEALLSRFNLSRDLDRLSRIPLFLGLLIRSHSESPHHNFPKRRSDLLEQYVDTLVMNAHEKGRLKLGRLRLRSAAERLAYGLLQMDETECPERDVLHVIESSIDPDHLLEDLRTCGLLESSPGTVRFSLTTVQEYLAGYELQARHPDEITSRFATVLNRPWRQALQFAVERMSEADSIFRDVLAQEDDAFLTRLKTVSRAIANGAVVSDALRIEIGDKLASVWLQSGFVNHREITDLLIDGFSNPLPASVYAAIKGGEHFNEGAEALLSAASDDSLTRAVLSERKGLIASYAGDMLPALNRIAEDALAVYINRIRNPVWKGDALRREPAAMATCIAELSAETIRPEHLARLRADTSLPDVVRLALFCMVKDPLPDEARPLLQRELHRSEGYAFIDHRDNMVLNALWRSRDAADMWKYALMANALTVTWKGHIMASILQRGDDFARATLRSLVDAEIGLELVHRRDLLIGYLGDDNLLISLSEPPSRLSDEAFLEWLIIASGRGNMLERALPRLRLMPTDNRLDAAFKLMFLCCYETRFSRRFGGEMSGAYARRHPTSRYFVDLFKDWAVKTADYVPRMAFLASAGALGCEESWRIVCDNIARMAQVPKESSRPGFNVIVSALGFRALAETVPLDILIRMARVPQLNFASNSYYHISRLGTEEALRYMLAEHNRMQQEHVRVMMLTHIEYLALRLGARIVWQGKDLRHV